MHSDSSDMIVLMEVSLAESILGLPAAGNRGGGTRRASLNGPRR